MSSLSVFLLAMLSPIILAVGGIIGVMRYGRLSAREKWIVWFLIIAFLTEASSIWMAYSSFGNNLILFSLFGLFRYIFFAYLYSWHMLAKRRTWQTWLLGAFGVFLLANLVATPFINNPKDFQLYDQLLVDGVILMLCLTFLYDLLSNDESQPTSYTTLNAILMVYLIVDLFMALTVNFMVNEQPTLVSFFWVVKLLATLVLYTYLSYLVWLNGKTQTPLVSG